MKLKELIESLEALKKFQALKIPTTFAFELSLFLKKITPEIQAFGESRQALLTKYAEKKEGDKYEFKDKKNIDKFNEELNEILEKEVSETPPIIKLKELTEGIKTIETEILMPLTWLIKK